MSNLTNGSPLGKGTGDVIDLRETLWNDGLIGPAGLIQIPTERITRLLGIMFDLDPAKLAENPWFPPADTPGQFYAGIRPVLQRHPLARHAEIRLSGTGLHAIIWLSPPVELTSAAEQNKWANVVRAAQCSLPVDSSAPGITALTRAVGSVNSKTGAVVEVLEPGEPIDPARVIAFVEAMARAQFKTVATILLGSDHVQPCPICRRDWTHLDVLDHAGRCYGHCGSVRLPRIFDMIYKPREPAKAAGPQK